MRLIGKHIKAAIRKSHSLLQSINRRIENIPVNNILRGGESLIAAHQYARLTGNLLRPSTRVKQGPHVDLLIRYNDIGDKIFNPDIFEKTPYFLNAAECIEYTGSYFPYVKRKEQIVILAKRFINNFVHGKDISYLPGTGHSSPKDLIKVRKIAHSDCFELIDGNHRIAANIFDNQSSVLCEVVGTPVLTPAQSALIDVLWQNGRLEMYQPVDLPEVQNWTLVRKCHDRLEKMLLCLKNLGIIPQASYFDVGASYGWFVKKMENEGYKALGLERDSLSPIVGEIVYNLDREKVIRSSIERFSESYKGDGFDIVSCFSLLHHFVLGKAGISAYQLLHTLDKLTNRILFLDSGQNNEEWFKVSLSEWTPNFIKEWVLKNSSFNTAIDLGQDNDSVGKFSKNYSRTLFAFLK